MPAAQDSILAELTEMINAVLGDFAEDQAVTMDTTFQGDLGMESIDVVSLAGRLQARYGDTVNFAHFVAKLDLETVGELRVGQLVEHIATSLAGADADEVGAGSR
ncbi:acyl carrier protein [Micromonospora sp. MW-13]|uniref:acyl carrier protein n=1 Tax=unclassified Micromonospora TaxID=2617518 RepID=UPI000E44C30D|nr:MULTISPECIES: acyl carrier protein [unclassified Micromonospora]MCX4471863.1 acyl carrier protein [Micromonospora sp. NBC_01655]RGC65832.1 acyl carrier protein [Micromonospora sp. MW-13]